LLAKGANLQCDLRANLIRDELVADFFISQLIHPQ
jgi:hypothetical protein